MKNNEENLFEVPKSLSPMDEWKERHKVGVYKTLAGFRASTAHCTAHGASKEEALLAWADKAHVKCWKAEELEQLKKEQDEKTATDS